MVKINANWGPLEAIMIDGYIPEHSELKKVDWDGLKKSGKLADYDFYITQEYLHLSKLPEQRSLGIFTRSMSHIINKFYPSVKEHRHKIKQTPLYNGFTIGKRVGSIEGKERSKKYKEFLPLLIPEYRTDEENSHRYIQNVVVSFPNCHLWEHTKYMKELEKYFVDSLKELHFKEKDSYKNSNTFKECWEGILTKVLKEFYSDGVFT